MSGVAVETVDRVGTITIDRPERRNALDKASALALLTAVEELSERHDVRALVLTGCGPAFCAGDDADTLDSDATPQLPSGEMIYLRVASALLACPKPVIAAINGAAVGAGTELACAADLRIAADTARIGSGLMRVGQVGNLALLGRVVGLARATEIYLTGRLVPADEALRIGLVDQVVPAEDLSQVVAGLAQRLASGPTRVIGLFKELRERCAGIPTTRAIRLQDSYHERALTECKDGREGFLSYIERREPMFTGS